MVSHKGRLFQVSKKNFGAQKLVFDVHNTSHGDMQYKNDSSIVIIFPDYLEKEIVFFFDKGNFNRCMLLLLLFSDEYFNSRLPIVMKRIAQGGVRLAMILNQVFGEHDHEIPPPTWVAATARM